MRISYTPDRFKQLIEQNPGCTASQLATLIGVTREDALYHLRILYLSGAIRFEYRSNCHRRGRPQKLYFVTGSKQLNNLPNLTLGLFELLSSNPLPQQELQKLAKFLFPKQIIYQGFSSKLPSAVTVLNQYHYKAHWEANITGPRIYFDNCPYPGIPHQRPECCELDRLILENITGYPVRIIYSNSLTGNPSRPLCAFSLNK